MASGRLNSVAFWFLFLSYAIGSPAFAVVEFSTGLFSERFDYSPAFIYAVAVTQVIAAMALWSRALRPWSIAVLTVLAAGAVYSHIRIDSPLTSIPALGYVVTQAWYGLRTWSSLKTR